MRPLSPEEAELWARVAATIRPMPGTTRPPILEAAPGAPPRPAPATRRPALAPVTARRAPNIGQTLDAGWDKRLRAGAVEPDRTVDLHGLTLDRAWQSIDDALERAITRGERVVLLITGHHRPGEPPVARGKIRAAVHDWLGASRHAPAIAAVRGAHVRHGGGGSLYLVLRRR